MSDTAATWLGFALGLPLAALMVWSIMRAGQREYEQEQAERDAGR